MFERVRVATATNDDWTLSQTLFGVTTYYRREADSSLSIKLEGLVSGVPLFEQVAVMKEVDLHSKWAPFCSSSLTIKDIDKLDTVGWFCLGMPSFGISRDGVFRAVGCDAMLEHGSILLAGQGIFDRDEGEAYQEPYLADGLEGLDIPDPPTRIGTGRMTIRNLSGSLNVLSPTSVSIKIIANVDPRISFFPQSLLDFIMRKLCGVIVSRLQAAAKKAMSNPVRNVHARRIRQESAFYKGWLLPKFQAMCEVLGWELPAIAALEVPDGADEGNGRRRRRRPLVVETRPRSIASEEEAETVGESSEAISGLTVGSAFRNNPIANYLREVEERTMRKKQEKISKSRERARNIIKAKEFSEDDAERLRLLEAVKRSREAGGRGAVPTASGRFVDPLDHSLKDDIIASLHEHSPFTRSLSTTGLVILTILVLFPEWLVGQGHFLTDEASSWWMAILVDIATFLYLGLCGLAHFVLCDVSLIYAFDALDLGMKSGFQSKKFYGDVTTMFVAALSSGSVLFSIAKALSEVFMRTAVYWCFAFGRFVYSSSEWLEESLLNSAIAQFIASLIPSTLFSFVAGLWSWGYAVNSKLFIVFFSSLRLAVGAFASIFLRSNRIGGLLLKIWDGFAVVAAALLDRWNGYVHHVTEVFDNGKEVPTWRCEAIGTSRMLLSYTAFFLLTALILFNSLSRAKKAQAAKELFSTPTSLPELENSAVSSGAYMTTVAEDEQTD